MSLGHMVVWLCYLRQLDKKSLSFHFCRKKKGSADPQMSQGCRSPPLDLNIDPLSVTAVGPGHNFLTSPVQDTLKVDIFSGNAAQPSGKQTQRCGPRLNFFQVDAGFSRICRRFHLCP